MKKAGFDLVDDRIVGPDSTANASNTATSLNTTSSDSSPAPTPKQRQGKNNNAKAATSTTTASSRSFKRIIDDVTGAEKTTIRTTTYRTKVAGSDGLQDLKQDDANDGAEGDGEKEVGIVSVVEKKRPRAKKASPTVRAVAAPPAKKRKVSNYHAPSVEDVVDEGEKDKEEVEIERSAAADGEDEVEQGSD